MSPRHDCAPAVAAAEARGNTFADTTRDDTTSDVLLVATTEITTTAAEIIAEHTAAQRAARSAVLHAIRCGEMLARVKRQLPRGEFGPWLALNLPFSDRTARGYMRLADLDEAKRQRVADMSLRGALRSIASPRLEDALADDATRQKLECLRAAHEAMLAILSEAPLAPEHLPRARAIVRECNDKLLDIGARGPRTVVLVPSCVIH